MRGVSFAGIYDVVMAAADRFGLAKRRRLLAREVRGRVIEIGAGTGLQFAHYPPGAEVYAVEPDRAMIERASGRACVVATRERRSRWWWRTRARFHFATALSTRRSLHWPSARFRSRSAPRGRCGAFWTNPERRGSSSMSGQRIG